MTPSRTIPGLLPPTRSTFAAIAGDMHRVGLIAQMVAAFPGVILTWHPNRMGRYLGDARAVRLPEDRSNARTTPEEK